MLLCRCEAQKVIVRHLKSSRTMLKLRFLTENRPSTAAGGREVRVGGGQFHLHLAGPGHDPHRSPRVIPKATCVRKLHQTLLKTLLSRVMKILRRNPTLWACWFSKCSACSPKFCRKRMPVETAPRLQKAQVNSNEADIVKESRSFQVSDGPTQSEPLPNALPSPRDESSAPA